MGLRDLMSSERGVVFVLLIAITLTMLSIGTITAEQFLEFAKWSTIALIASKTVTTAVETIVTKTPQIPTKSPP